MSILGGYSDEEKEAIRAQATTGLNKSYNEGRGKAEIDAKNKAAILSRKRMLAEKDKGIDNRSKRKPVAQNRNKRSEPSVSKSNTNARQGLSSSSTTNTRNAYGLNNDAMAASRKELQRTTGRDFNLDTSRGVSGVAGDIAEGTGRVLRGAAGAVNSVGNFATRGLDQIYGTGVNTIGKVMAGAQGQTRQQALSGSSIEDVGTIENQRNLSSRSDEVLSSRADKQLGTNNPDTWAPIGSRYKKTGEVAGFNKIRDTETGKDNIYTNLDAAELREGMNSRGGYVQSNSGAAGSIYGKDSMENYMRELRNKQETHAYNRGLEVDARKMLRQGNEKAAQELMGKMIDPGTVAANTRMQSFNTEAETNRQKNELAYDAAIAEEQNKQQRAIQKQKQSRMDDINSELSSQTYDFWTNETMDENGVIKENVNNEGIRYTQEFMMAQPNLSEIQSRSIVKDYFDYAQNPPTEGRVAPPEALKELLSNPTQEMISEFYSDYQWLPSMFR